MDEQHPFDRVVMALDQRGLLSGPGCSVKPSRFRARCPAHEDHRASLGATRRDDRVLLHCFAGCSTASVVHKIGLTLADLFDHLPGTARSQPMQIVARYDYYDLDGVLVAQKVRMQPKAFRWHRPNGTGGWRPGCGDDKPGLYRLPELIEEPQVFVCEGEKAVDRLWSLGLPATCPPSGASRWLSEWSVNLWAVGCRDAIILPDAARPGRAHAERVCATIYEVGLEHADDQVRVKMVPLPGLLGGADVCDWFDTGHTPTELENVARAAPYWFPGVIEQTRLARRRMKGRERVRLFRARQREARAHRKLIAIA